MASFYGNESGSKTASGQRFNQNAMTAAHRTLPFGTKLRVTHGGRSVVVTINDRGPFIRGRVLDLSTGAARAVGLTGAGVGRVTAEVRSFGLTFSKRCVTAAELSAHRKGLPSQMTAGFFVELLVIARSTRSNPVSRTCRKMDSASLRSQ